MTHEIFGLFFSHDLSNKIDMSSRTHAYLCSVFMPEFFKHFLWKWEGVVFPTCREAQEEIILAKQMGADKMNWKSAWDVAGAAAMALTDFYRDILARRGRDRDAQVVIDIACMLHFMAHNGYDEGNAIGTIKTFLLGDLTGKERVAKDDQLGLDIDLAIRLLKKYNKLSPIVYGLEGGARGATVIKKMNAKIKDRMEGYRQGTRKEP